MFLLLSLHLAIATHATTQTTPTPAERFAQGRVAFDKYKDCNAALEAFIAVQDAYNTNPVWQYYASEAFACLKDYEQAHYIFGFYAKNFPTKVDVQERLAELGYLASKSRTERIAREDAARATAQAVRDKAASLQRRLGNLEGLWERNDGRKFRFSHHTDGKVYGYPHEAYGGQDTQIVETSELVVAATFKNGVLKGWVENFFNLDAWSKCEKRGKASRLQNFELTISDNGERLSGQQEDVWLTDCEFKNNGTRSLSFERVKQ